MDITGEPLRLKGHFYGTNFPPKCYGNVQLEKILLHQHLFLQLLSQLIERLSQEQNIPMTT